MGARRWWSQRGLALLAVVGALVALALPAAPAQAVGDSWATRASMPTARNFLSVAAATNGKLYALGGRNSSNTFVNTVEEYDPATNTWAAKTAMPTARIAFAAAGASNGKVYAIGGGDNTSTSLTTVEEYDPATNVWTNCGLPAPANACRPMPTGREALGMVAANGKLYAIGGTNGNSNLPTVEEYDPATNIWTNCGAAAPGNACAPMPTARQDLGLAAASNGKFYAIGGSASSTVPTVEEYDPAANVWTNCGTPAPGNACHAMPTARQRLGAAAAPNGKVYAIGGANATALPNVEEFDPATNNWATRTPMPTARLDLGVATAANGLLYAIGGFFNNTSCPPSGQCSTVEEYTPPPWVTRAAMTTARASLGVAAAPNGKLYAAGGVNTGGFVLATLEEYDPAANMWTTRVPMPTARQLLGLVAGTNGKLYAIGGANSGGVLNTVEEYDPGTNAWAPKAAMPTARDGLGVAAAPNGKLYAIGGFNGTSLVATVEEYDPGTNVWTNCGMPAPGNACHAMPTARDSIGLAAATNGKLYAIGGNDGIVVNTAAEYDPATNTWAPKAGMLTSRRFLGAAAALNGKVYAIGGTTGGSTGLASVEEYDPAANTWALQPGMNVARLGLGAATAPFTGEVYAIGGVSAGIYFPWVEEFLPPGGAPPSTATATPTRTSTPAATPTPTLTPTRTLTPTITLTPTAVLTPYPRPNVAVGATPVPGTHTVQAPIAARDAGCAQGNNQLLALQFTRLTNATVDVPGAGTVSAPQTVPLPGHPASLTLTVHQVTGGQAVLVELVVTDGCGDWPTFVGGGPGAF